MKKLVELKQYLEHGDNRRISEIAKVPKPTVDAIVSGARNSNTPTGEKIRKAAQMLIDSRRHLKNGLEGDSPEFEFSDVA